jgi:hypothetical protein
MILIVDVDRDVSYYEPQHEPERLPLEQVAQLFYSSKAYLSLPADVKSREAGLNHLAQRYITIVGVRWPYYVVLSGTLWASNRQDAWPQGRMGHIEELGAAILKDTYPK